MTVNIDADVAMDYVAFVVERHKIWQARQAGLPQPWTDDPILARRKFTNVFRVLDPGSQFVLTDIDEPELDERDTLARLVLYRYTNRPATWQHIGDEMGGYPTADQMGEDLIQVFREYRDSGNQVFSGAYIILPQPGVVGTDKCEDVVNLARTVVDDVFPEWDFATSQEDRFDLLLRNKGVGKFLAMQILTDWGYTHHGSDVENEFVICGPGADAGARELDRLTVGDKWPAKGVALEVLEWCWEAIYAHPGCPTVGLSGGMLRRPSAMDVQNTLCEFSKYARLQRKMSSGPPYSPDHPGVQPAPLFPEHWSN